MGKLSALPTESTFTLSDLLVKIKAAAAGDVGISLQDFLTAVFVTQIASSTNPGTAAGTIKYLNLGGLKIMWGRTAAISIAGAQQATATLTFPATFTTAPNVITSLTAEAVETKLRAGCNALPSTTAVTLEICTTTATNAPASSAASIDWLAIGV